jgi:hypothetical protein
MMNKNIINRDIQDNQDKSSVMLCVLCAFYEKIAIIAIIASEFISIPRRYRLNRDYFSFEKFRNKFFFQFSIGSKCGLKPLVDNISHNIHEFLDG